MQHRANGVRVSLAITGADQAGTISARWSTTGQPLTGPNGAPRSTATRPLWIGIQRPGWQDRRNVLRDATASQAIRRRHDRLERATDSLYEDQISIPAGYDETTRWTHGDYAFGDSGGPPQLDTLSTNLRAISDPWAGRNSQHRTARADYPHSPPVLANYNRRAYHARRWRWLAYRPHNWPAEFGDSDVPQPTIYWTYDGSTWNSKTLTGDAGTDQFFDLTVRQSSSA